MSYINRTMIVTAARAVQARDLCGLLAGPPGDGMFVTPLSPTGTGTPTHYISAGLVEDTFAAVLGDPAVMHSVCVSAGIPITLEECTALLGSSDITPDLPASALSRLGLQIVQPLLSP